MEIIKTTVTQEIYIEGPDVRGLFVLKNNNISECKIEAMSEGKMQIMYLNTHQIESLCKEFGEVLNFINTQNKKECTQNSMSESTTVPPAPSE